MSLALFLPRDAAALAVGADRVARAIEAEAAARQQTITLTRTGSRGLHWLEPMLELDTPAGRLAYGPVKAGDVPALLADLLEGRQEHPSVSASPRRSPFSRARRG